MILTSLPPDVKLNHRVLRLFASFHPVLTLAWCWKGSCGWCLVKSEACACDVMAYAIVSDCSQASAVLMTITARASLPVPSIVV